MTVSLSGNWSSGTGRMDGERVLEGEETRWAGRSPASARHCGPRLGLASSPRFHLGWNIPVPRCVFPAALTSSPCGQRLGAPGGRCRGSLSSSVFVETDKRGSFLRVLFTNCCQLYFTQYQQFSHLSIHQNHLEGLLILRYLGPTCLSLWFVGLEWSPNNWHF